MHALWKGSISFGLVNIPVNMYTASREHELKFVMLHKKDLSEIRYAKICKNEDVEVFWKDIVKGFEYQKGKYVVLTEEDFAKADVKRTKTIEIVSFAKEDEIDTIYYSKPYYLEPDKNAASAYSLLCEALKKSKKVGIARYVIHNREHIAVIKPYKNMLMLDQLRFADEIKLPKELEIPKEKVSTKELDIAIKLIGQLTSPFDPKQYKDAYAEEIKRLIAQKAKGKKITTKPSQEPKPSKVHDIMSLLKASLDQPASKKRKRVSA